jgi:hypothetical protein
MQAGWGLGSLISMLDGGATNTLGEMSFSPHVIASIKRDSAAYGMLQVGDEVAAINGQNVTSMHPTNVQQLFAKYAATSGVPGRDNLVLSIIRRDKGDNWGITSRKMEISINISGGPTTGESSNETPRLPLNRTVNSSDKRPWIGDSSHPPRKQHLSGSEDAKSVGSDEVGRTGSRETVNNYTANNNNNNNNERDMYSSVRSVSSTHRASTAEAHARNTPRSGQEPDLFSSMRIAPSRHNHTAAPGITRTGSAGQNYTENTYKATAGNGSSTFRGDHPQKFDQGAQNSYHWVRSDSEISASHRSMARDVSDVARHPIRSTHDSMSVHRPERGANESASTLRSTYDAGMRAQNHESSPHVAVKGDNAQPARRVYVPNRFREEEKESVSHSGRLRQGDDSARARVPSTVSGARSQVRVLWSIP